MEEQMVWISTAFTFCLLESWSRDQSECTLFTVKGNAWP